MSNTSVPLDPHPTPNEDDAWWCVEHGCESDACPDDESDCELIAMSEHHQTVHDDIMSNWFEEDAP